MGKVVELEQLLAIGNKKILGLVETHENFRRFSRDDNIKITDKMRTAEDKKGGGIKLLHRGTWCSFGELDTRSPDVSLVQIIGLEKIINVVIVYVDVGDQYRINVIYSEIERILDRMGEEENIVIMGDFNGHVGIVGHQEINLNGRRLIGLWKVEI